MTKPKRLPEGTAVVTGLIQSPPIKDAGEQSNTGAGYAVMRAAGSPDARDSRAFVLYRPGSALRKWEVQLHRPAHRGHPGTVLVNRGRGS
jgi:hypothetical protein